VPLRGTLMLEGGGMARTTFLIWLIASIGWAGFIAYGAIERWPHIPLDMGGPGPSVDAAYQAAQLQHTAKALLYGIGVPVIGYILMRFTDRAVNR
jgi:hypothetical protein